MNKMKGLGAMILISAFARAAGADATTGKMPPGTRGFSYSWLQRRIPACGKEPIRAGKSVRLGAYVYGGLSLGEKEWPWPEARDWIARNFDIYSAGSWPVDAAAAIRRINPAICLLLMVCPVICSVGEDGGLSVGGLAPERMAGWRLLTKDGEEAPNTLWGTKELGRLTYFMDIGNQEWAAFFREQLNARCRKYGADGYCIDGVPWNGVYYLQPRVEFRDYASGEQVNAAIYRFLDTIRTPREYLVVDDVPQPERQARLDGVWGEDWLAYDSTLPFGQDRIERWEEAVEYVARYSAQRKPYIAAAWYHYGKDHELEYLLATYLLAKHSDSVVFQPQPMGSGLVGPPKHPYDLGGYHLGLVREEIESHRALFDVELGLPIASRERRADSHAEAGAVWQRRFQKGLVLVNASTSQAAAITLSQPMRRPRPGRHIARLGTGAARLAVLPPADGEMVVKAELPPRSGLILLTR